MATPQPPGPVVWIGRPLLASKAPIAASTPFPIPRFSSMKNWKGLDGSGRARAGGFQQSLSEFLKSPFYWLSPSPVFFFFFHFFYIVAGPFQQIPRSIAGSTQ